MDKSELQLILQEGEGYKMEFKESLSNIDRELVAFANSSGGRILLGVTDAGVVKGVPITNDFKSRLQDIANNCRPKIKITLDRVENVLVINVREGEDKPCECSSGFFKRIGSNSQKMTRNEIIDFFKSEGKVRFDELMEPKLVYPRDFDKNKLRTFLQLAELSKVGDAEKLLTGLGVAEKQEGRLYINNAGVLFFAKEPQRFVPWSVYTVALFKDKAGVDIIDRKEIGGSLIEIVEEVMKFVRLYAKVAYRFTGRPRRENVYEYSFDAIREAVINSVMHKYYFEHGHNNILRFLPDRIRIENYWHKPAHFVLGKTVFRRNHIIADLLAKIHFGEKMGTGFERIREACMKENAPFPEMELNENYFHVTFRQSKEYLKIAQEKTSRDTQKDTQKIPRKYPEDLNQNQVRILKLLEKDNTLTRDQMSRKMKVSPETVKKNIEKLKQRDLLKRIGSDKGGYWEINLDEN